MEIDALVKAKQAELKDREETVKKLEKSLKEPGSKVKQEEFNKAAIEYQRMAQAAESEIKKKAQELRTTVLQQIKKIIETIGEENNFLMIFTTDNVPFFQKTLDVTDQIIKKLDESGGAGSQTQPPVSVEPLKMPSSPAPPPPPAKK
jgi:Skp family chaperone for outer membrane proteins